MEDFVALFHQELYCIVLRVATHTQVIAHFSLPVETSYSNNSVVRTVVPGVPVDVGSDQLYRLWLGPAVPNPSTGEILLRFSLPSSTPVALAIYDIAGRQVQRWKWDNLAAGSHSLRWDGHSQHGSGVASGIYFLKFVVGGRSMTQKIVRLH